MLLPRDLALRFINGYKPTLLRVLANAGNKETGEINTDLTAARTLAKDNPSLIEVALASLAEEGKPVEPDVASAIRSIRVELWLYVKHTKTFAVFLDAKAENGYAVRALTTPLNELVDEPPFAFEAGIFEYEGMFVCDGLVLNPIALGPGYRSQLKAAYSLLRKSGGFHARTAA